MVRPKKHLGQHFLTNTGVAEKIAASLTGHGNYQRLLEIGPGTGALTRHLLPLPYELHVAEIDGESVVYLNEHYPALSGRVHEHDFLAMELSSLFGPEPVGIIGNFPYNISTQILFRVYEQRNQVPEVVGMFQREVARRIVSPPGNKDYGILSVLLQTWYDMEYLFTVNEGSFNPPPKVKSGVIRLRRNTVQDLGCNPARFAVVVKTAFNQRRKTLRNSLKGICPQELDSTHPLFDRRPETLSVEEFVALTRMLEG